MSAIQYVLGIILILLAIVLIVAVLLQESRSAGLSGAISGGADTFFGKGKGYGRRYRGYGRQIARKG